MQKPEHRTGEHVATNTLADSLSWLAEPVNETVLSQVRLWKLKTVTLQPTSEVSGKIAADDRIPFTISSRVGGRIERLYINYALQQVYKGQKLLEVYSPELVTAQKELLFALKVEETHSERITMARSKLLRLGMSTQQVDDLIQSGKPQYLFPVYSPVSGYVATIQSATPSTTPNTIAGSNSSGMGDMGGMSTEATPVQQPSSSKVKLTIQEGSYVALGEKLFTILPMQTKKVELFIPATSTFNFSLPQTAALTINQRDRAIMTISKKQPEADENAGFIKVWGYVKHTAIPGSKVVATITGESRSGFWVPSESVYQLGKQQIVFVFFQTHFKPVAVNLLGSAGEQYLIEGSGIEQGVAIAANAQFMIDSESFIKSNSHE